MDGAAFGAAPRPIKPQDSESEDAFDRGGVFTAGNRQQRPCERAFVHTAANVKAREGMFEVRRSGERFDGGIGKPLAKDAPETRTELLPGDASGGTWRIRANKFEMARFCAAEPPHFEDHAALRAFLDAEDAAGQVAVFRPKVDERMRAFVAKLAVQSRKLREPLAVLTDLRAAGSGDFANRPIEFGPIVHEHRQR